MRLAGVFSFSSNVRLPKWLKNLRPDYLVLYYRLRQVESALREFRDSGIFSQVDVIQDRLKLSAELDEIHAEALDRLNRELYQVSRRIKALEEILAEYIEWEQDEEISLRIQLRQHTKNRNALREQAAKFGGNPPLNIVNDIDDTEEAIENIQARLRAITKTK